MALPSTTKLQDKRYGLLTCKEYLGQSKWRCRCDCGRTLTKLTRHLPNAYSCGCQTRPRKKYREDRKKGYTFAKTSMVGKVVGALTVLEYEGRTKWRCQCVCGEVVVYSSLKLQTWRSCGCRAVPNVQRKKSPEYISYRAMLNRCYDAKHPSYSRYGGRGIRVCDRWRESFQAFVDDMGLRPEGHTLDRLDNDGDYEPGNCRWTTPKEQRLNQRKK